MPRSRRRGAATLGAAVLVVAASACSGSSHQQVSPAPSARPPAPAPTSSAGRRPDADYAAYARTIIPSGQYGSVPPPAGSSTQAKTCDALTPLFDKVTDADS